MRLASILALGGLVLSAVVATRPSLANGAFPAVSQLVFDPGDEQHLVLRSNFGLVSTRDGGKSWDWVCEQALGYSNIEPPLAVLAGGVTLLGLPTGAVVSDVAGCDFHAAQGLTANVTDVSAELGTPGGALAVSVDWDETSSQVWESLDAGAHWLPLGPKLPHFSALTIDAARSDSSRIYVSGMDWSGTLQGALLTSRDHGQSWEAHAMDGTDAGRQPYIAALDPKRADTVYLRLTGLPGKLEMTQDAGASFAVALTLSSPIQGFAVSPDGATLVASTVGDGIFRAPAASLAFERVACEGLSCLAWGGAGLVGCGEQAKNGFGLGLSADVGRSFGVLLDLRCLRGPLACAADSSSGAVCSGAWPAVAQSLGRDRQSCDPGAVSLPFSDACWSSEAEGGVSGEPPMSARDDAGQSAGGAAGHSAGGAVSEAMAGEPAGRPPLEAPQAVASRRAPSSHACSVGNAAPRGACSGLAWLALAFACCARRLGGRPATSWSSWVDRR